MSIHALVMAGSDAKEPLSQHFHVSSKALVNVADKPMAYYPLAALHQSQVVARRIYIGDDAPALADLYDERLESHPNILDNLTQGINHAQQHGASDILLVSGDIVWLQPSDLQAFMEKVAHSSHNLIYPIISAEVVRAQFPRQTHRKFARVRPDAASKSAEFTGGSVIFVRQAGIDAMLHFAERAYNARKNLWALAQLLGANLALQFLSNRLTLAAIEKRVSHLLGTPAQALLIDRAGLAMDVDTLEELAHAEADLAS